eukprot:gb/GECG01006843.1/.p1 GENE.gb/GECG01006843.1/~~gb/GECG01006843.1/.p1  ORF type:complete len:472 (+),score=40.12 gb/GECG01006843.1/:1-1416(+)
MASRGRKLFKRVCWGTGLLLPPACVFAAYRQRQRPAADELYNTPQGTMIDVKEPNYLEAGLSKIAGAVVTGVVSNAIVGLLRMGNDVEVIDAHKLHRYVLLGRNGQPLLTVSNHTSVLDDPGAISLVVPTSVRWQPSKMRWSVCSEEYCFPTPAMSSFFSCGNGIPIQRGASIYQLGMAKLAHKLDEGCWVHLFPEGRIWQETGHPPRDSMGRWCSPSARCGKPNTKVGPMKWGVGKLIANSDVTPVVVPFFHLGMDELAPQNKQNNIYKGQSLRDPSGVPGSIFKGSKVIIKIGDPVDCVDLIRNYHIQAIERAKKRHHLKKSQLHSHENFDWSSAHPVYKYGSDADLPIARSQGPDVRAWLQRVFPASGSLREGHNFPSRRTPDGRPVPAHREPLLRIKPPDHEMLTPEEAAEEEKYRLELYENISDRLGRSLETLEREVRELKKQREAATEESGTKSVHRQDYTEEED